MPPSRSTSTRSGPTATTTYEQQFANWNVNGNGDDLYLGNLIVPLDYTPEGSANAAVHRPRHEVRRRPLLLGQQATSAFLLWATAADAVRQRAHPGLPHGPAPRHPLLDGGGLSTAQDPGANIPGHCALVMKLTGTSYVQWAPAEEGAVRL